MRQDRNRKRKAKDEKEEAELKEMGRLQKVIQTVVSAHQETCSLLPVRTIYANMYLSFHILQKILNVSVFRSISLLRVWRSF